MWGLMETILSKMDPTAIKMAIGILVIITIISIIKKAIKLAITVIVLSLILTVAMPKINYIQENYAIKSLEDGGVEFKTPDGIINIDENTKDNIKVGKNDSGNTVLIIKTSEEDKEIEIPAFFGSKIKKEIIKKDGTK